MEHETIKGDVLGTGCKYSRKPVCLEITISPGCFE